MNAADLVALLGKSATHPEIRKLLERAKVEPPGLQPDEIDARVSLFEMGIALVFQPEGDANNAPLRLVDVQLYRGGGNNFGPFQGALPCGLAFADSRSSAHTKLGRPARSDDELDNDSWDYDGFSLILEYADNRSSLGVVHVQMPDEGDVYRAPAESSQRLV